MPRVSVLVPAYNVEPFVEETLRSIAAQTRSEWEIVAVDDRSSDRTYEILQGWASRDPRVRVFRNEKNLGMTANWNRCLAEARGDFVIKLDADDAFRPRTLEVLLDGFAGEDVIGASVRTLCCDEDLKPFDGLPGDDALLRGGINPYADVTLDCSRWYMIAGHGVQPWHSCAIMLRRDFLKNAGGYDERFGCASDTELIWRVLEEPCRFAHSAYVGVLYRIRSSSVSSVYRANDWLTSEGTAANLLSLHRFRLRHGLPRRLRFRYASQWNYWHSTVVRKHESLPMYSKLAGIVATLDPPSMADRALVRMRESISALVSRA